MKSNPRVHLLSVKGIPAGVDRAKSTVGVAIREWLRDEIERDAMDFSDIILALHFVVAQESAAHALSRCHPKNARNMKKQYSDLVALCLDTQFERLIGLRRNEF